MWDPAVGFWVACKTFPRTFGTQDRNCEPRSDTSRGDILSCRGGALQVCYAFCNCRRLRWTHTKKRKKNKRRPKKTKKQQKKTKNNVARITEIWNCVPYVGKSMYFAYLAAPCAQLDLGRRRFALMFAGWVPGMGRLSHKVWSAGSSRARGSEGGRVCILGLAWCWVDSPGLHRLAAAPSRTVVNQMSRTWA